MKSGKLVVAAVGTSQTLAYGTTSYLPAILAPSIALSLDISIASVFLGLTSALITSALVGPYAGKLVDTGRGRDVLIGAHLVYMLGLLLLGLSTGLYSLLGAWVVIGVGMAIGQYETSFAVLTSYYGKAARPSITGITLIAGFASTICWPLSSLMDSTIGWRNACFVWASCHVLLALPLIWGILPKRPTINHSKESSERDPETGEVREHRDPSNIKWILTVLSFLFLVTWFTTTSMGAHLPLILASMGMDNAQAVAIAAIMGPMQVVARFSESILFKRFHPLAGARFASFLHPRGGWSTDGFWTSDGADFHCSARRGKWDFDHLQRNSPRSLWPENYGLRQGILMIPARIGMAVAPFTFGLALAHFGPNAVFITGGLTLIAGLSLFTLTPNRTRLKWLSLSRLPADFWARKESRRHSRRRAPPPPRDRPVIHQGQRCRQSRPGCRMPVCQ